MKTYRSIQTLSYQLEGWLNGTHSLSINTKDITADKWGVEKIVKIPGTSWLVVTVFTEINLIDMRQPLTK